MFMGMCSAQVHFDIYKPPSNNRPGVVKRSVDLTLNNHQTHYRSKMYVGTPPQEVEVLMDTGSSDFWIIDQGAQCVSKTQCPDRAKFSNELSQSFVPNNKLGEFDITYGDGTRARGIYGKDVVRFGSAEGPRLRAANLALVNETNSSEAVCGIGLLAVESMARSIDMFGNVWPTYPNLPMQMKQQGLIRHVSYSLWLNDKDTEQGSLLFGAVDDNKYQGELQRVPLVAPPDLPFPIDFSVMLDGIYFQNSTDSMLTSCSLRVLLDSGTSHSMLPMRALTPLMQTIGAKYDSRRNIFTISNSDAAKVRRFQVTFDLSGIRIVTNVDELLVPLDPDTGSINKLLTRLGLTDSYSYVALLPLPDGANGNYILSDAFLRNAYVVYDLESKEIAMAQAKFNVSDSKIVPLGGEGVRKYKKAPRYDEIKSSYSINTITANVTTQSPPSNDPLPGEENKENAASRSLAAPYWILMLALFTQL